MIDTLDRGVRLRDGGDAERCRERVRKDGERNSLSLSLSSYFALSLSQGIQGENSGFLLGVQDHVIIYEY